MAIANSNYNIFGNNVFIDSSSNDAAADVLKFQKSRAGGVITTADSIGGLYFQGFDGTNFISGAQIICNSTQTIAGAQVPANLLFQTHPNSNSAVVTRMTINYDGTISMPAVYATAPGGGGLHAMVMDSTGLLGTSSTVGAVSSVTGTALEITASPTTGNVVLSLPVAVTAPGSLTTVTSLTAGSGFTVTAGTITLTPLNAAGMVVNSAAGVISTAATTQHALQVGSAGGQLSSLGIGATGTVLAGNTGADPSFATISSLSVTSVNGTANQIVSSNSGAGSTTLSIPSVFIAPGSIEGTTSIKADTVFNTPTSSSTVGQYQINGTSVLHTFGTNNVFVGSGAGNFTTSGTGNSVLGEGSLAAATSGYNNTIAGMNGAGGLTTGFDNIFLGVGTAALFTTGSNNIGLGTQVLPNLVSGTNNIALGFNAGGAYTGSESNNVLLGDNVGVIGDASVIRIGDGTGSGLSSSKAFIGGIYGVTGASTGRVMIIDANNQLSAIQSQGTSGFVLTSNGAALPTWQAASGGGVPSIAGTANQINESGSPGATTLSLSSTIIAPGSVSTTTYHDTTTVTSSTAGQYRINASPVLQAYGTRNLFLGGAGNFTLTTGTSTYENVAAGADALVAVTSGARGNVAIGGRYAMTSATTATFNTAVGYSVLGTLKTGIANTALGNDSGGNGAGNAYTTSESYNIVIQNRGVIGDNNTIRIGTTGSGADQQNKFFAAGVYNTAVGATAGVALIDSTDQLGGLNGSANTFLVGGTKPSFASSPTASGTITGNALASTTTVTANTVFNTPTTSSTVGQYQINGAAVLHTFGTQNTFVGQNCGNFTMSAQLNTGIGYNCLTSLTSAGNDNVGCGRYALNLLTTGHENTAVGDETLDTLLTGQRNTAIGYNAGGNYTGAESNNICIGSNTIGVTSESNTLHIGLSTGTGIGQLNAAYIAGINGITVTGTAVLVSASDQLGIAISSRRYKDNISPMHDYSSPIHKLKPVTFTYNVGEDQSLQSGLIAEDVYEVMPSLVVKDKEGLPQTVKYHDLPALLLNEIQKMQRQINALIESNKWLTDQITEKDR